MDADSGHHSSDDTHHINDLYFENFKLNREKQEISEQPIATNALCVGTVITCATLCAFVITNDIVLGATALSAIAVCGGAYGKQVKARKQVLQSLDKKQNEVQQKIKEYERF